jgi:PAS domain S-box-containing protein
LLLVNILVIFPVLLIGTIFSIFFISQNEQSALKKQIASIGRLTASYSTADLLFNDQETVQTTLANLDVFPNIAYACILDKSNQIIATYGNQNIDNDLLIDQTETNLFIDKNYIYRTPIIYKNNDLGTLVLVATTERLQSILRDLYIGIIIASIFSFLVLFGMSYWLQRFITRPISILVKLIERVVNTGNYSTRLRENRSNDEIGILYKDFNHLMEKIDSTTVSKNYVDSVLDSLAEMLLVIDENQNILTINDAVFTNTKFEASELIGQSVSVLLGERDTIINQLDDGKIIETRMKTKENRTIFISISVTPFINKLGENHQILSIRDITKQKSSEAEITEYYNALERTNKELEKLSYITSHDLKAPLRGIGSLVMMMEADIKEGEASEEEINDYFNLIRKRIKRMDGLINGILEYSKVGRGQVAKDTINLDEIVIEIIETVIPKDFEVVKSPNFPTIKFNKVQIYQLFQNLIGNAVKYNDKPKGKLELLWKDLGDKYQFIIKDNGPGIEPKYHSKVFEVFQMLQSRDRVESTGIGLSIVKKIVEQEKGYIYIESEKGKGVAFIMEFPKNEISEKLLFMK